MNIEDLTLKQIRELQALFQTPAARCVDEFLQELVGKNVAIRTVTMIYTGKMIALDVNSIVLLEAAWIPDTSRWMSFVANGTVGECEPYPDDLKVGINRGSLLDYFELKSQLPRSQK